METYKIECEPTEETGDLGGTGIDYTGGCVVFGVIEDDCASLAEEGDFLEEFCGCGCDCC